jgi:hypothetical protein
VGLYRPAEKRDREGLGGEGRGPAGTRVVLARAVLSSPERMPSAVVLVEVGWTSVGLRWTEKVLQEWTVVMTQPLGAAEKTMLVADVGAAIERREHNGVGAKASGVGF